MQKTLAALDEVFSKLIATAISTKFWFSAIGFLVSAYMAYQSGGWVQIVALLSTLGFTITYTLPKMKQNIELAKLKNNGLPEPKSTSSVDTKVEPEYKPLPPVVPEKPFDVLAFHERVLSDAGVVYGELNPYAVFSEAIAKGTVTTCYGIQQAKDYWDYLVPLAYAARDYVKEQTEKAKGACKGVDAPEYVLIQSQLARILQNRDNVYRLSERPWADLKKSLDANDSLYLVGVLSDDLLRTYWS